MINFATGLQSLLRFSSEQEIFHCNMMRRSSFLLFRSRKEEISSYDIESKCQQKLKKNRGQSPKRSILSVCGSR